YNHPNWSLESAADYINYDGMFAVEIYNSSVAKHYGLSDDEAAFDCLLRAGKKVFCSAADDNHNQYPFSDIRCASFGGWACINAEKLEYGEIMTALQNGDFYASTGPEIFSLTREGNTVTIECSAAKRILVLANTRHAQVFCAENGEGITKTTFELSESDSYFRIRVEDFDGNKAYTQAYKI
ncbi:MAG: PHP domain-containing protein, partial [Oscillospiraceae bacterium]|nr:PHP domain-containing protein [Oscillospiraceae bacterium]